MEKIQEALEKAQRHRRDRQAADRALAPHPDGGLAAARGAPATKVVPADDAVLREQRVVVPLTHQQLADTFRILRTQVLQKMTAAACSTLAVTSPGAGEGKTLTAVNLAVSLSAYADRFVLLVDLDLRRPGIHRRFGIEPERGLTDYLANDAPLSDCLVNPGIDRLVVLPAGAPLSGSSEMLATPKMALLAEELKSRYPDRIVIYDLPPLLLTDDALVFLRLVDGCLLVVEEGATRREDLARAVDLLKDFHVIGTVLNKARETAASRSYG
jgi:capsular exopolysaccharide synthesis family protein